VAPGGAGDARAAALTWARQAGHDPVEAVRWGVAAGTASAMKPGLNFANRAETEEILGRVTVRRVETL
ncbi:MAG: 1-phosphofructokinase family hexose kinase, partial [Bryobacterales bacterium]|nr:1-phosphofructokinase family hexose kinase [Bryobacterales bacterium]